MSRTLYVTNFIAVHERKNKINVLLLFQSSCKESCFNLRLFKFNVCPTQYLKWRGIHIFFVSHVFIAFPTPKNKHKDIQ